MLIKSVVLHNFRNYPDAEIYFSTDPKKNVTLIVGGNAHGKTNLINAFGWCLYRKNMFVKQNIINDDVAHPTDGPKTEKVIVTMSLSHEESDYTITTTQLFQVNAGSNPISLTQPTTSIVVKDKNGKSTPLTQEDLVIAEIEKIMPEGLSNYFFFDGENNSIEDVAKKRKLSNAINSIMGLDRRQDLMDYFDPKKSGRVFSKIEANRVSSDDEGAEELQVKLDDAQRRRANLDDAINKAIEGADNLGVDITHLQAEIDTYKEVEKQQASLRSKEKSLELTRSSRDGEFNCLVEQINAGNGALGNFFAAVAYKRSHLPNQYANSDANKMGLEGIDAKGLTQIQERGVCICGKHFEPHDECWEAIEKQKQYVTPNDFTTNLKMFFTTMDAMVASGKLLAKQLNEHSTNLADNVADIDDLKKDISVLEDQVRGYPEVGKKQDELIQKRLTKQKLEQQADFIRDNDIPKADSDIEDYQKRIKALASSCEENDFVDLCESYCRSVYSRLSLSLGNERNKVRTILEEKVNQLFHAIYGSARNVVVNDDFSVDTIVSSTGVHLDPTPGLETMVNFSFVGSLVYLAKYSTDLLSTEDDPGLKERCYPLVMDAPFSVADSDPISRICSVVPEMCNQVIMFVMKKDAEIARPAFKERLGKEWEIVKLSESHSNLKEVF